VGLTDVGLGIGKDLLGPVRELGDFIRAQRTQAQISLRALADKAGVSNPYLSQVERGLRRPSAAILTQIADGLSISAETLLAKAGILRPHESGTAVVDAIRADARLTERQKTSLVEIYTAFVGGNGARNADPGTDLEIDTADTRGHDPDRRASRPAAKIEELT
jgi:transcriptional regulator with XRE-family HTH domain